MSATRRAAVGLHCRQPLDRVNHLQAKRAGAPERALQLPANVHRLPHRVVRPLLVEQVNVAALRDRTRLVAHKRSQHS
jgi:hypothetical protein